VDRLDQRCLTVEIHVDLRPWLGHTGRNRKIAEGAAVESRSPDVRSVLGGLACSLLLHWLRGWGSSHGCTVLGDGSMPAGIAGWAIKPIVSDEEFVLGRLRLRLRCRLGLGKIYFQKEQLLALLGPGWRCWLCRRDDRSGRLRRGA
jgi:hypothetical protein